jgi:HTH-type transcriptional regulator/antitoxin HigA
MEIMNAAIDVKHLLPVWEQFRAATDITPIRDEAHYARMTEMLQALLDETQGEETHPAMGLVDIVGDLIEDYEAKHHPLPEVTGVQALKFLMEQHGLKQSDLSEIGSQGVVSEILTGKKSPSLRLAVRLEDAYGIKPRAWLENLRERN